MATISGTCEVHTRCSQAELRNLRSISSSEFPTTILSDGSERLSSSSPASVEGRCHVARDPTSFSGRSGRFCGSSFSGNGISGASAYGGTSPSLTSRQQPTRCGLSEARSLNASRIGRYPVQRQRFPSSECSISALLGSASLRSSEYIDMTNPGVQKPHCEPWKSASFCWTGWSLLRVEPIPSTVITWQPSMAQTGAMQAFTERCTTLFFALSKDDTDTVHAPQPPSPQPSFVPVSPSLRSHASRVCSGWNWSAARLYSLPFTKKYSTWRSAPGPDLAIAGTGAADTVPSPEGGGGISPVPCRDRQAHTGPHGRCTLGVKSAAPEIAPVDIRRYVSTFPKSNHGFFQTSFHAESLVLHLVSWFFNWFFLVPQAHAVCARGRGSVTQRHTHGRQAEEATTPGPAMQRCETSSIA
jgi:hypothetical protein